MTSAYLERDVQRDEGLRLTAYPDPESERAKTGSGSGDPWTCGYGCTGADVTEGTTWTQDEALQKMRAKLAGAIRDLDRNVPWWRTMSDLRQDVLANMAYNMGWPRLSGFKRALSAMRLHDWSNASRELLDSRWASQVHGRADRLARQMLTGVRAP